MTGKHVLALVSVALASWSNLVAAHYFVPVGDGSVGFYLGFIVEPAYEGEPNGIEIYPFKEITHYENGVPIDGTNVGAADQVDFDLKVQLVDAPDPSGKVLAQRHLGKFRPSYMPEQYLTKFIPYPSGLYALILKGAINGQRYEGRLFCSPDDHSRFACVLPKRRQPPTVFGSQEISSSSSGTQR